MSSSSLHPLSRSDGAAMLCPRSVCLLVRMSDFFCQWYFKACGNTRIALLAAELFQLSENCEESSSLLAVRSCWWMWSCLRSLGELVQSAHHISAGLTEKYGKDILEGPLRLAVNASCSPFNFPTICSFSIKSSVGFAIDFAELRIAPSLLNPVNVAWKAWSCHTSSRLSLPRQNLQNAVSKSRRLWKEQSFCGNFRWEQRGP